MGPNAVSCDCISFIAKRTTEQRIHSECGWLMRVARHKATEFAAVQNSRTRVVEYTAHIHSERRACQHSFRQIRCPACVSHDSSHSTATRVAHPSRTQPHSPPPSSVFDVVAGDGSCYVLSIAMLCVHRTTRRPLHTQTHSHGWNK